ncbi:unnamed protein product [Lactuca saligna]|uniref:Uncharacterized protein n=1 Tax=Lactuca saligna TaxID=75948 RepID=A0AA35Y8J0_LACSI|nr:unnamed protein product [Lactuca saligna]
MVERPLLTPDLEVANVADEHDQLHNVETKEQLDQEGGDEDFNEDDDFLKDLDFTGINNDNIPSNLDLNLDDDDFGPLSGFDDRHFKKFNEVVQLATKTGDDVNALKILLSSSKPMEDSSRLRHVVSRIPPLDTNVSTSVPFLSEPTQPQTSFPSPRQGVFIQSQAPPVSSFVTTTTVSTPLLQTEEGPSTVSEAGRSSSILEYSPSSPSLDEASVRLAKHLAQNISDSPS